MSSGVISPEEVAKFDQLAARWWDPAGPMKPLHRMNPARIGWINDQLPGPTSILDIGCGAGLASEALARLGHDVLGVDAAGEAIEAAKAHAAGQDGLRLTYRAGTAEDLVREGVTFPVITALEVIEHVPNPAAFVRLLASLLEPDGMLILSTLNRTRRSFLTAKLGAEYVLRMLPAGTHDWRSFLTPAELARLMRMAGLRVRQTTGLAPDPLSGQWRTVRGMAVNYMIAGVR
ncbi:MAG TPA: bifunctional 2-polyprenyl-6-hydroxyphenol methylase/3-demethylubiquinol 3-O-methyltransferase UbiG [Rhodopila sp.]|nr:bifunctional 2-polyprenyl-6-hydroxyphenol methylase/3-demethylubiquinol 3-O-methyltransferase UbiG [Rhodopila sp.]